LRGNLKTRHAGYGVKPAIIKGEVPMIKLVITQEHIDGGGRSSFNCPIALALHENGYPDAKVYVTDWAVKSFVQESISLSTKARDFIRRFDYWKTEVPEYEKPKPTTITLRSPRHGL
jgi:hypothetical protein